MGVKAEPIIGVDGHVDFSASGGPVKVDEK